ncbi:hypothetical protein Pmani_028568 [Petrolisthes manimaculis]|uniref:Uncharacterized protein n=1 Tax=Petrolisthes manimaculis TaxID=1843537 RepID=A0AAE1P1U2_9EUCA|nr:hypothetical protein Pmani_028568 [Petrolisthes manimaculis]
MTTKKRSQSESSNNNNHNNNNKNNSKTRPANKVQSQVRSINRTDNPNPNQHQHKKAINQTPSNEKVEVERGPSFFQSIGRLVVILGKGFVAVTLFALIFNFSLALVNKFIFRGTLDRYIPLKGWKDVVGK